MATILSFLIDRALDTLERTSPENRAHARELAEQRRPRELTHAAAKPAPRSEPWHSAPSVRGVTHADAR